MKSLIDHLNKHNLETLFVNLKDEISPNAEFSLLTNADKVFLHSIAKLIPDNGTVVELGCYLGGSTSILAHSNNKIQIHAFDLFDNKPEYPLEVHYDLIFKSIGFGKGRSIEHVQKLVDQYQNIYLHKVIEGSKINFDKQIDLYIEDANHNDPILNTNLNEWLPKIKVGGYALLHDYRPSLPINHSMRFIDVEKHVDNLIESRDWIFLGTCGDYAVLQKVNSLPKKN